MNSMVCGLFQPHLLTSHGDVHSFLFFSFEALLWWKCDGHTVEFMSLRCAGFAPLSAWFHCHLGLRALPVLLSWAAHSLLIVKGVRAGKEIPERSCARAARAAESRAYTCASRDAQVLLHL